MTVFSFIGIDSLSGTALFAYGLLAGLVLALAFSSQRWLLWYLFGGMAYWLAVEAVQSLLISRPALLALSEWHSYVIAMGISWLPLAGWVLYRAIRYDDVSQYSSSASCKPRAISSIRQCMTTIISRVFIDDG
ncbi:AciT family ciprofloxacin tolerance protein [Psychrobacter celer]|uniref:AciT family ciprofloxacin tolerance protein n=1 Tax=Psychrobacter celer TaxID=306572 RepID=UPI003FD08601